MVGIIIDITLGLIAVFALVIGAIKGMARQFGGFIGRLAVFIGAMLLTSLIIEALHPTDLYKSFVGVTTGWFNGNEALATEIITEEQLQEALANAGFWKVLAPISATLFADMNVFGCSTLSSLFGWYTADLIADLVIWTVLYIVLKLILKGITRLLVKVASLPVIHTLDRIFGAIWSIALTYVILVGVLWTGAEIIVVKFFPDSWEGIANIVGQTTIFSWLNNTNILGSLLAGLLNTELPQIVVAG